MMAMKMERGGSALDEALRLDFLKRVAKGLAAQFGRDCEIVVHDLSGADHDHTIVAIENGHVSGRSVGDGPSQVVLEALRGGQTDDRLCYCTRARDGRRLRSSTIFMRDGAGRATGILSINYDLSGLTRMEQAVRQLLGGADGATEPQPIPTNVNDLLDQLLEQSVEKIGRPVSLMTKEDKQRAVQFLNDAGAFLITRAGDKISKFFGISKYTMYTYFDAKEAKGNGQD